MGTIELHLESSKGEKLIIKNPYLASKIGFKENKPYLRITAGRIEIYFLFEDKENFNNFVSNLKEYWLETERTDINPELFTVEVYREDNNIIEGKYSYLEFLSHGDKPAFFISLNNKQNRSFEIYFYFDIKEELEKFIGLLEGNKLGLK